MGSAVARKGIDLQYDPLAFARFELIRRVELLGH
jgi:hypothetical protein